MTEPLDERAGFEAWAVADPRGNIVKHIDDDQCYASTTVQNWWTAWQARADLAGASKVVSNGWVSVEDRLPETVDEVLTFDGEFQEVGYFFDVWLQAGTSQSSFEPFELPRQPTHWMPLPTPPNGGEVRPLPEAPKPDETNSKLADALEALHRARTDTPAAWNSTVQNISNSIESGGIKTAPTVAQEPAASDHDYWLSLRSPIIEALAAEGYEICSDRKRVWLKRRASQEQPPQEPVAWRFRFEGERPCGFTEIPPGGLGSPGLIFEPLYLGASRQPPQEPVSNFVPVTPGGTVCMWLESKTEAEAWRKLLKDAAHMPFRGIEGFKKRGFTIAEIGGTNEG